MVSFAFSPRAAAVGATLLAVLAASPAMLAAQTIKNDPPEYFRTNEFRLSYHLGAVKTEYAYGRGFAGSGQRIAVYDSGIKADHPDFRGQLAGPNYDVHQHAEVALGDTNWHGTFVSGILAANKDSRGMHGMAYEAKLIPIRMVHSNGTITASDLQMARGIRYASDNGARIHNNSWNSSANIYQVSKAQLDYQLPKALMAWRYALDNAGVVVFAAGNEGKAHPGFYASLPTLYPELERGWVAVVATVQGGSLAPWSNRCGSAATWCMAAPGSQIVSTYINNGYAVAGGTSFAAPVVSAAVAILKQRWPHLTNKQVRELLFRTANKTGIYADAAVYGQGFLDLDKATAPIGTVSVPTSGSTGGASSTTSRTGTVFGRGIRAVAAGDLPVMIVLDEYQRDYLVDGSDLFSHISDSFDATTALAGFGNGMDTFTDGASTYAFSYTADGRTSLTDAPLDGMRLFIEAPLSSRTSMTSSFNVDPSLSFGLTAREELIEGAAVDAEALTNPYMTLAKSPVTFTAKTMLSDDVWLKAGSFMGEQATDPTAPETLTDDPNYIRTRGSVFGSVAEIGVKLAPRSGLAFNAGFVEEEGAFLGSTSSGATRLADKTTTGFIAASARFDLGDGFKAFGGLEMGWTNVDAASNSLVKDIAGVTSQSFRAGLVKTGIANRTDTLGLVVSQPLRVGSGAASLDVPVARDEAGNITTEHASLGLATEARELDVQAFYATEVSKDSSFSAGLLFRQNAGHVDGRSEAVALARYKLSF